MKTLLFPLILVVFNMITQNPAGAVEPPIPQIFKNLGAGKKQTVVTYGTSLTAAGAWTTETKHWFDAAYPGLVTFVNSGGSGMNSDWGLENLKAKVLDHHPDLVFIEFSYNDAHEKFKMPVQRGAENLDKIVQAILKENPETTIVLQVMNCAWDAPNGNRSLSVRPHLNECNNNYRTYAAAHNLALLDHYVNWLELKESDPAKYQAYIPDGTHPEKAGSLAVTWPSVKDWLVKSSGRESVPVQP